MFPLSVPNAGDSRASYVNRVSIFDWSKAVGQPNWYRSNLHYVLSVFERLDRFEVGLGSFR